MELFWEFFWDDFKLRYKKSYLGALWAIINPLAQFFVLYNIWSIWNIRQAGALIILSGIILFNVFSESFHYGMQALMNKAHIILKIYFPREIVVYSAAAVALINLFFNFWVVVVLGRDQLSWHVIIAFLISAVLMFFFGVALALWVSVNYVRFRDLHHIVELIIYVWFWVTPILYPIDLVKGNILYGLIKLNPLTNIIIFMTKAIHPGVLDWDLLGYPVGLTIILLILGNLYFRKAVRKIAEYY